MQKASGGQGGIAEQGEVVAGAKPELETGGMAGPAPSGSAAGPLAGEARAPGQGARGGGVFPTGLPRRAVAHPARSYVATRVLTAPPQVLVLMLMDGVLREVARALQVDLKAPGGRERLHRALTRAQDFLRELMLALDHQQGGELAARLSALYLFCQERLIEANVKANPRLAADAVRVLAPIREAWAALCAEGAGGTRPAPSPEVPS
ncbi:flagellar export chaperone FliS [Thermaerobacter sp. PB12/4term]|uniref:flagellar export chaperone FliS n=1 Tax=Thermaerobacter sp. PB12/4term TaxID=2293838 RepID=UPI000E32A785|nr:flagellar export chaperone FliS [Thermaerobacter sp. PB12/4term]QIA26247.1 flagellar export chaperone FliS [Thermaerobacter sp. PB12/4term]